MIRTFALYEFAWRNQVMGHHGEHQNLPSPNTRRRHKNSKSKGYGELTDLQKAIQRLAQRIQSTSHMPPRE